MWKLDRGKAKMMQWYKEREDNEAKVMEDEVRTSVLYEHIPILSKPQPNLNLTLTQRLGFTRKWLYTTTTTTTTHPPHKLKVSNISAVTDPILMQL